MFHHFLTEALQLISASLQRRGWLYRMEFATPTTTEWYSSKSEFKSLIVLLLSCLGKAIQYHMKCIEVHCLNVLDWVWPQLKTDFWGSWFPYLWGCIENMKKIEKAWQALKSNDMHWFWLDLTAYTYIYMFIPGNGRRWCHRADGFFLRSRYHFKFFCSSMSGTIVFCHFFPNWFEVANLVLMDRKQRRVWHPLLKSLADMLHSRVEGWMFGLVLSKTTWYVSGFWFVQVGVFG